MSTLEDLKRKVQSLKDQLAAAEERYYTAVCEHWKLTPETIVLHKGAEVRVIHLRHWREATEKFTPWVVGYKKNKDGNWSKRLIHCFSDWQYKP